VINIFARNYPNLLQQQLDEGKTSPVTTPLPDVGKKEKFVFSLENTK